MAEKQRRSIRKHEKGTSVANLHVTAPFCETSKLAAVPDANRMGKECACVNVASPCDLSSLRGRRETALNHYHASQASVRRIIDPGVPLEKSVSYLTVFTPGKLGLEISLHRLVDLFQQGKILVWTLTSAISLREALDGSKPSHISRSCRVHRHAPLPRFIDLTL